MRIVLLLILILPLILIFMGSAVFTFIFTEYVGGNCDGKENKNS